jgi:histidinol dehydrogenase
MRWSVRIVGWHDGGRAGEVEAFLKRPAFDERAETVARKVLAEIKTSGDRAVLKYAKAFDGVRLNVGDVKVSREEIRKAKTVVDAGFRAAVSEVRRRVAAFARAGLKKDWRMRSAGGGWLGEKFAPLDRIGVYVPGGKAPLVSTVLMTATPAQVAGVRDIVACTPCDKSGAVNPFMLYALDAAGVTEIYRVGGIQAIGLMAYGTQTIEKVQKIVGPGGVYVTAAKRQVYGHVALDLVAGPSEIAVLADETADATCVAADLLSQAEHGTGWEKALLVTNSRRLAAAVRRECDRQARALTREAAVRRVMEKGMLMVVVGNLAEGVELCNRFAPEHLEIMARNAGRWLKKIRAAGAVFLGKWTPESAGDFVAGPSHVLPTGGSAARFSGLTAEDFRRRSSVIAFTRADLAQALPVIEWFGRVEQLDAHARSARIRFER